MDIIAKNKSKNYLVLLPKYDFDIKDSISECLGNIIVIDDNTNVEELISYINNNKQIKKIIPINNIICYDKIIPNINNDKDIEFIFTKDIASFTDFNIKNIYNTILRFYDRGIVKKIWCTDACVYEVMKKAKYNCGQLNLYTSKKFSSNKKEDTIGILSNDFDPKHNFYNQLTAIKLLNKKVKIISNMPATINFVNDFKINTLYVNTIEEVGSNNIVNLYINFANNNYEIFFKSMNAHIPCLMGNTNLFTNSKILEEYLTLKSDDDVNEIASKIKKVIENKELILKEYEKFKDKYSKKSIKCIKDMFN